MLWKGIVEDLFDDLLRFAFPEAESLFDLSGGFDFLNKELRQFCPDPGRSIKTAVVDKLVKVYQANGNKNHVLFHIEVQHKAERLFVNRMFDYYTRILVGLQRPLTAIAIFTGKGGTKLTKGYMSTYYGTELAYKYKTIRIFDYDDQSLLSMDNPFALVMLAAKKALLTGKNLDDLLLQEKLAIARILFDRKYDEKKTRAVLDFLHNYIRFEDKRMYSVFSNEIDRLTGKTNTMETFGIAEQVIEMARQEGRKEGLRGGRREGKQIGYLEGKENGYLEGKENGYLDGKENGYLDGKENGYLEGKEHGYLDGKENGYLHGKENGYLDGKENGYLDGKLEGLLVGKEEGIKRVQRAEQRKSLTEKKKVIKNLIGATRFSDRKIADIADAPEALVKKIRQKMK